MSTLHSDTDVKALPENEAIAQPFEEIASRLEAQRANPFRIKAYRNAASTIRELSIPISRILKDSGIDGLMELPGIGSSIANAIRKLLKKQKLSLLERLRGDDAPDRILRTIPFLGPTLARRIHERLGITTLAELRVAAWDGRLAQVPGMGRKRIEAIQAAIANRPPTRPQGVTAADPEHDTASVAELLDVDQQYRQLVTLDRLQKIAPRRFNPEGKAWLPILQTRRGVRHYTAFFSNTARAHELGATRDWVVICCTKPDRRQWTVITAGLGKLKGKRVVRGRESECRAHYDNSSS